MTRFDTTPAILAALLAAATIGCQTSRTAGDAPTPQTGSEFQEGALPAAQTKTTTPDALDTVYFDLDEAAIRGDARSTLAANARRIQEHAGWGTIVIEGHCDERGSEEYNMALGQRRAAQVKQYLVDLGVPGDRLDTVSFGESRPAVEGSTEEAFRYNRRSDFEVADRLASH